MKSSLHFALALVFIGIGVGSCRGPDEYSRYADHSGGSGTPGSISSGEGGESNSGDEGGGLSPTGAAGIDRAYRGW